MLICDFTTANPSSCLGTSWEAVSDQVMGGVSNANIEFHPGSMRLSGNVRLDNNGGFIQAALDLAPDDGTFDASRFSGVAIAVSGPPETYALNLRTSDLVRPWQSYRAEFQTTEEQSVVTLPFSAFSGNNTDIPLNTARLRRIGVIAVSRAFYADIAVHRLEFI